MNIITNNVPRFIIYKHELPEKEQEEFDYLPDPDSALIRYKGDLYPLQDFVRIMPRKDSRGFDHSVDDNSPLLEWHGIVTTSYFTAILMRFGPDCETVVVGHASW